MGDELATSNVNRSYSLAATSIAIFTFMLFFLYPRFASGEINALLFQVMLALQRYLTRCPLYAPFSVGQKGAVVTLLDAGSQLEDVYNRQGFDGQHHL